MADFENITAILEEPQVIFFRAFGACSILWMPAHG
jgi:hypothetical protein